MKVSVGSQYVTLKPADNKSAYYRAGAHPSFAFVGVMMDGTQVEIPIENENFRMKQHLQLRLIVRLH